MKTIKQIADELGVDKQKVYRFIKRNHISEAHHDAVMMYYDEVAETLIASHFCGNDHISEAHHDVHQTASNDVVVDAVIKILQQELEAKNQQIADLAVELSREREHSREISNKLAALTENAQTLHLGTIQQQMLPTAADSQPSRHENSPETESPPQPGAWGIFSRIFGRKQA